MLQVAVERGLAQRVSAIRLGHEQRLVHSAFVSLRLYSRGHKLARVAETFAGRELLSKALRQWVAVRVRIWHPSQPAAENLGEHAHGPACCIPPNLG